MKEQFIERSFSRENQKTIVTVNLILDQYRKMGFRLSLRQLYYQMVSRDYIPNTPRSYKNLGSLVSNARQAGLVDWEMIEDRNRETVIPTHWETPADIVEAAARQFRMNKWEDQPWHIEIMVEKDALSGVLDPVCRRLDIGLTANKGYSSSSTMYEIGKRLREKADLGKKICVFYLGDHDPSGIDMTRDVKDRLLMYSGLGNFPEFHGDVFFVERLALNMDQIEKWKPPENPAKETDARFYSYVREFGSSSWELDAIEPGELANLVTEAVLLRRDDEAWEQAVDQEEVGRAALLKFVQEYNDREE
jgi:hypothetical protein